MKIPFLSNHSSNFKLPTWEAIAAGAGAVGVAVGSYFAYSKFFDGSNPFGSNGEKPSDDLTKDELYAQAQEEDISGRSTMNKDELIEALSKE
jgi:hypothetical protein